MREQTDEAVEAIDQKRARLRRLLAAQVRAAGGGAPVAPPADPGDDPNPPLSVGQRALWFLQRLAPESAAYNIATVLPLPPSATAEAVRRALAVVIDRHPLLRTTFSARHGEPVQRVRPPGGALLDVSDTTGWAPEAFAEAARVAFDRPFDLEAGPLLRAHLLGDRERASALLLVVHHIVGDTLSLHVVSDEILHLLDRLGAGATPDLPPLPTTYAAHVRDEAERLAGPEGERLRRYWEGQFPDGLPTLDLGPAVGGDAPGRAVHPFAWAGDLPRRLEAFTQSVGTTPFVALLAAYAVLLQRYARQDLVPIGTAAHGRTSPAHQRLVGYFASPVLLRLDLAGDPTFRALLRRAEETVWGALEHQDYPFPLLVERLHPDREEARVPGLQVMFVHQQAAALRSFGGWRRDVEGGSPDGIPDNIAALLIATMHRGGEAALSLELFSGDGVVLGGFAYDGRVFPAATVEQFARSLRVLIEAALDAPDRPLSELPLLTGEEVLRLGAPAPAHDVPRSRCVHTLFEEQAARTPDAVAVEAGDIRWTYADLDARADGVADALRAAGERATTAPVALLMDRSPDLVAAMLGVLKAGGSYLPVDLRPPPDRVQSVLADAGVRVAITAGDEKGPLSADIDVLRMEALPRGGRGHEAGSSIEVGDVERPAYVLYTSGSTGAPKGVVVPHRAVVHLVVDTDYAPLTASDRVAHLSNVAFDAATFEVWGALLNGATLVVVDRDVAVDPERLAAAFRTRGVTTAFLTTALFNLVAQRVPDAFCGLRRVLFGGEHVDVGSVARVLQHGPPEALLHVYGPTEATTFSTWHRVEHVPAEATTVPIGRPIARAETYVLDNGGRPIPDGFPGELYVGGPGVALGYLRRPDLTASAFVPHPSPGAEAPATRLYRTGDLVRRQPGGDLVFLGRVDRQVKVRGFRVEPGEVEAVLRRHPAVVDCAVEATEPHAEGRRLLAFVVLSDGEGLPSEALDAHCRARLPDYMVPARIVPVPEIPLTANGKVDRRRLLESAAATGESPEFQPPQDPTEERIAHLYEELLRVPGLGRDAHFFRLGGHSLLAVRLVALVEEAFGVSIPLRALLVAPTVAQLAVLVRRQDAAVRYPAAVPVQPLGTQRPLFLVPGAGGNATQFYALGRHLGEDQPLYVLEGRGRDGGEDPHLSIADMVAYGIEVMRHVQPAGPYALLGYSVGGLVAFEMANELERTGHEVAFLGILDTANPTMVPTLRRTVERRVALVRDLGLAAFLARSRRHLGFRVHTVRDHFRRTLAYHRHRRRGPGIPESVLEAYLFMVHRRAFFQHRPRPFSGRVVLFRTKDQPAHFPADLGWGGLAAGGVEVREVEGDHLALLTEPTVQGLASVIGEHLPGGAEARL